ncbi:MAG TPA: hypothetical protein VGL97_17945, partial [Bryobacteraceae bacterium]
FLPETATLVAYDSPHRILETLADMQEVLGDRPIVLARELTKLHEEFLRGSPAQVRDLLLKKETIKGEITLVIGGAPAGKENRSADADPLAEVAQLEREGIGRMAAIKTVAKRLGLPKREVYRLAAGLDNNPAGKRRD